MLPEEFIQQTHAIMGDELFGRYMKAFEQPPSVSIRLNPRKTATYFQRQGLTTDAGTAFNPMAVQAEPVPWCRGGYYLMTRPTFTFDPLLHAGLYYVQEASSMFLDLILQQYLPDHPITFLDLCAAPGGKSTLIRSALPEGSMLVSNEPMPGRAQILSENVLKWGYPQHTVTRQYPRDFRRGKAKFDAILCDVPCSGEGMFRKDAATIGEWSPQNVERCWRLQREIVADAWACLGDGGLFIYSTCTFNTKENEENIRWMMEELGAKVMSVDIRDEWQITGSLLKGFTEPVYRFIPGTTRGEGLFMCVMRKSGCASAATPRSKRTKDMGSPKSAKSEVNRPNALAIDLDQSEYPTADLSYQQAMSYLRHEAIVLPASSPRGIVLVTFKGMPLGFVKNIGNRANNLYPKEWSIRTTHIPNDYETILKHS